MEDLNAFDVEAAAKCCRTARSMGLKLIATSKGVVIMAKEEKNTNKQHRWLILR